MEKRAEPGSRCRQRRLALALVAVAWLGLSLVVARTLAAQLHLRQGRALEFAGQYGKASEQLQAAARIAPGDSEVALAQGWVRLKMATRMSGLLQRNLAGQAVGFFRQAIALTPLEPEAFYGLGQALAMAGGKEGEAALAAYRQAIALWPNNPYYHRALAEALHGRNRPEELVATARTLGRIYPGSYQWLRRQPYWGEPNIQSAFLRGLAEAIAAGTDLRQARSAKAEMLAGDGAWLAAAAEYRQALALAGPAARTETHFQLGTCLLRGGDRAAAEQAFSDGLAVSRGRVADLAGLARTYRALKLAADFPPLLDRLRGRYPLGKAEVVRLAEKMLEQQDPALARALLAPLTDGREYLAEPYYLLSRIAEREGDWEGMAVNARRALNREPERAEYQRQLARALEHRENR